MNYVYRSVFGNVFRPEDVTSLEQLADVLNELSFYKPGDVEDSNRHYDDCVTFNLECCAVNNFDHGDDYWWGNDGKKFGIMSDVYTSQRDGFVSYCLFHVEMMNAD